MMEVIRQSKKMSFELKLLPVSEKYWLKTSENSSVLIESISLQVLSPHDLTSSEMRSSVFKLVF
jgi:hypothetical protein